MGRATETLRAHMIERDMNRMKCPVCREEANEIPTQIDGRGYDCPNCGCYLLSGTADSELSSACDKTRTILSHTIWTGQREGVPYFEVFSTHVDAERKHNTFASGATRFLGSLCGRYTTGYSGRETQQESRSSTCQAMRHPANRRKFCI